MNVNITSSYFQQSKPTKRFCPFGRDCFYQHRNEGGTAYVFPDGVDHYMRVSTLLLICCSQNTFFNPPIRQLYKSQQHRASENGDYARDLANHLGILGRIFNNPLEDLSDTIEALRLNLPAFLERLSMEDRDGDRDDATDEGDDPEAEEREDVAVGDNGYDDTERTLERLASTLYFSLCY